MTCHILVQQERRTDPARMAIPISASTATGKIINDMPEYVAGWPSIDKEQFDALPVEELG